MATIGARGAKEVARIKVRNGQGYEKLYVLASDDRVLSRHTGDNGSSYTIRLTGKAFRRVMWASSVPRERLIRIAAQDGYKEVLS